jgi:hypothetical protein
MFLTALDVNNYLTYLVGRFVGFKNRRRQITQWPLKWPALAF